MKKEKLEEILSKLKIEKNKWSNLKEINSIILKNGRTISSDWEHTKFLINEKLEICLKHGTSKAYGARLPSNFLVSSNRKEISFSNLKIESTKFYKTFRFPSFGDTINLSKEKGSFISSALVEKTQEFFNKTVIFLFNPLTHYEGNLSYFETKELTNYIDCMHSEEEQGIYMKFTPNEGKKDLKHGIIHEKIKIKDISFIDLKIGTPYFENLRIS